MDCRVAVELSLSSVNVSALNRAAPDIRVIIFLMLRSCFVAKSPVVLASRPDSLGIYELMGKIYAESFWIGSFGFSLSEDRVSLEG